MTATFIVGRTDLRQTRWQDTPAAPLAAGTVRAHIDRFALTSNNITYGAFGEGMNYWSFFPTGEAGTGCIPVWGFATVTESRCESVAAGERFYGYYPIADEVVLHPVHVDANRFLDGAPHRRELHSVYNQYLRCSSDPLYSPANEAVLAAAGGCRPGQTGDRIDLFGPARRHRARERRPDPCRLTSRSGRAALNPARPRPIPPQCSVKYCVKE